MTAPLQNPHQPPPLTPSLTLPHRPGILRTQLRAELTGIAEILRQCPGTDSVTTASARWHANFSAALNLHAVEDERLLSTFTALLQDLLVDDLGARLPLDENALLGSDGHVYGSIPLRLHLYHSKEPYKYRSPLDPENRATFVTTPHILATHLVRWLQRRGASPSLPAAIEQSYQELLAQKRLPPVPTLSTEKARHIKENKAREKLEQQARVRAQLQPLQELLEQETLSFNAATQEALEPITELMQEQRAEHHAQLIKNQAQEKHVRDQIHAQLDQTRQELSQLQQDNDRLRANTEGIQTEILSTEQQGEKFQLLVNEVKEELRRRNEGTFLKVLATVAAVGICTLLTYGVSSVITSSGLSANACVTPSSNGFKLATSLSF